jgi:hypothetical protein
MSKFLYGPREDSQHGLLLRESPTATGRVKNDRRRVTEVAEGRVTRHRIRISLKKGPRRRRHPYRIAAAVSTSGRRADA